MICTPVHSHHRQHLHRTLLRILRLFLTIYKRHHDIFQCIGSRQQIKVLKHKADSAVADRTPHLVRHAVDVLSFQIIAAGGLSIQYSNDIHQCTFSGTRLTDDGNELSLVHGKIDSVQDFQFIGLTYIICLYNFFHSDYWFTHYSLTSVPVPSVSPISCSEYICSGVNVCPSAIENVVS